MKHAESPVNHAVGTESETRGLDAHLTPIVRLPRRPWIFPFIADYRFVERGIRHCQIVRVLERFGGQYRIEALELTKIHALNKPLPPGVSHPVPVETIKGRL